MLKDNDSPSLALHLTEQTAMKQLDESQLGTFDQDYIQKDGWAIFTQCIKPDFPSGVFHLLDVGGGNGFFSDRILDEFPQARVTLIDNADNLLKKNTVHPNKTILNLSAEHLDQLDGNQFDVISINWVLHHLVGSTYSESRKFIEQTLRKGAKLLKPNGRFSIMENMYNGLFFQNAPSRLIFELTSLRSLAPITHRLGANTAGVGVCFLSHGQWSSTFDKASLVTLSYEPLRQLKRQHILIRTALHLGDLFVGHFWLSRAPN